MREQALVVKFRWEAIEQSVPTDSTNDSVVAQMSSKVGIRFETIWLHDLPLGGGELFADYYEPDEVYLLKIRFPFFDGSMACPFKIRVVCWWSPEAVKI